MKWNTCFFSFIFLFWSMLLFSSNKPPTPYIITFFFQTFSEKKNKSVHDNEQDDLICDILLSKNNISEQNNIEGIYVLYYGMATSSNYEGQVIFPRQNFGETFEILITDSIIPIILFSNTIHHFRIKNHTQFKEYTCERKKISENNYVWHVTESYPFTKSTEAIRISPQTLIIYAQPQEIFIRKGTHKTSGGNNIVLPPILVANTIQKSDHAFQFLKISKFFSPIMQTSTYAINQYAHMMIL